MTASGALTRWLSAEDGAAAPFRRLALRELRPQTRAAMIRLAGASTPGLDAEAYVGPRLAKYQWAILWGTDDALASCLLVDQFEEEGRQFVYLGPLFSRGGACVDMVIHLTRLLFREHPDAFIYFAAEFQNPEALLMFKRLFFHTSFPHPGDGRAPPEIAAVVQAYARRLPHVGPIDLDTLSTRAAQTLFRPRRQLDPLVQWMARRGVDFSRGDSQIILVTCDPSPAGRLRTFADLQRGARALADWKIYKPLLIEGIGGL